MTTMGVNITVRQRDPETNEVIAVDSAIGTTEDDGVTVVIGNGYIPAVSTVPSEDIEVTLIPAVIEKPSPEFVSRVNDAEANTSTIVFSYPSP